ncbi:imelysin family protein [Marinobacter zhejiangensis]|uniref:Imelysin n=1 Tax=Marinobacter zhejiangensis TaxID=488535 RepID=A0A1I4SBF2_9GAMM|nr:imelysin family protein [Marinobacter zhejiangensis]SFM61661.1 Imelysin [Marinobacter zhejiangensis]
MKQQYGTLLPLIAVITLALSACNQAPEPEQSQPPITSATPPDAEAMERVGQRSDAVCATVATLHATVTGFLDAPSTDALQAAQAAWLDAHDHYRLLAADYKLAAIAPPQVSNDRDTVDAWPMIPGYLDQVPGYPRSGLVYSEVPLTPDFLASEHQSTDFHYLTQGFHPLEFMLWGSEEETPASQALKFDPGQANDDDLDIPGRRRDLTRLMSVTLARSVEPLCVQEEQTRLAMALAKQGQLEALAMDPARVAHEPTIAPAGDASTDSEEAGQ